MIELIKIVDERIEALVEQDWDRYNALGQRIIEYLEEKQTPGLDVIPPEGHFLIVQREVHT